MIRIALSGVAGVGKSSTARALASQCRKIDGLNHTELISEYARRYINKYGSIDFIWEQYRILEKQLEWEENVINDKLDVLITDCPLQFSYAYCLDMRGKPEVPPDKESMIINDIYKKLNRINYPPHYDFVFHIPPKLKPVDDGVRLQKHLNNNEWKEEMNRVFKTVFKIFPPRHFFEVEAVELQERVNFCLSKIEEHKNELN